MVYDVVGSRAVEVPDDLRAQFGDASFPAEWPSGLPQPVQGGALCGVLHPAQGAAPEVSLATNPTGAADPSDTTEGHHEVDVEPSTGAYVLSGSDAAASDGTRFVIDTKGEKYELIGSEVPDYIGYADVEPPLVPSSWLKFFTSGVPLSTNSARRLPEDAPPESAEDAG